MLSEAMISLRTLLSFRKGGPAEISQGVKVFTIDSLPIQNLGGEETYSGLYLDISVGGAKLVKVEEVRANAFYALSGRVITGSNQIDDDIFQWAKTGDIVLEGRVYSTEIDKESNLIVASGREYAHNILFTHIPPGSRVQVVKTENGLEAVSM